MATKLTREQVEHVARLAQLRLSEEEIEKYREQLGNILTYIEKLNELDTEHVEPTSHVLPLKNVFREDEVTHPFPQVDFLKLAPETEQRYYKVPKIIE